MFGIIAILVSFLVNPLLFLVAPFKIGPASLL